MQIELKKIHSNPLQPRGAKVDVTDLVESLPVVGLIQPIVVAKNSDGYVVIAGHRRLAAATKLGWETIEADVVDLNDPKLNIARIMAENEVRSDLTGQERAAGFQTMIDLGWSDDEIRSVTAASDEEVKAARTLSTGKKKVIAKMPATASLLEMEGLLEFEGTEEYQWLLRDVGTSNFFHQLARLRQEKARRERIEATREKLTAAGVRIISREMTWDGRALILDSWQFNKVEPKLTASNHKKCPGHCAVIDYEGRHAFHCDRPDLHGVKTSNTSAPKTEEQKALDKTKREMRALWRASTGIRAQFVMGKLNLKKPDARLLRWALNYATETGVPAYYGHNVRAGDYTKSKDSLTRFLAICVWQVENAIDDWIKYQGATGKPGSRGMVKAYLAMLVDLGYLASDHELAVAQGKEYTPPEA